MLNKDMYFCMRLKCSCVQVYARIYFVTPSLQNAIIQKPVIYILILIVEVLMKHKSVGPFPRHKH